MTLRSLRRTRSSGARNVRWQDLVWVGILLIIAAVQVIRAQVFDAVLFGSGALLLALNAGGVFSKIGKHRTLQRLDLRGAAAGRLVLVALGAVCSVLLVLLPRHGVAAAAVMVVVGLVAAILVWPQDGAIPRDTLRKDHDRPPFRVLLVRAAFAWSAVLVAMCLVELWAFLAGRFAAPAASRPVSISELLDPALDTLVGRITVVAAWLALGFLLLGWRPRHARSTGGKGTNTDA